MKSTIKLFLVIAIATSTIFAEGDMNNGGYTEDGDMNNGGRTCTINCPIPNPTPQSTNGTSEENSGETDGDDSIVTVIENYLISLFG
jgi:hypothetical protein